MLAPKPAAARGLLSRRGLLALGAAAFAGTDAGAATLAQVRERGRLIVGLYEDMPPFHVKGQGIDMELGQALAEALGVKFAPLAFNADENMNDDLRNMVWKGHYLGHGPADVLMHVPVDRPLIEATPQARIFGPYYRERVMLARRVDELPRLETLSQLGTRRVGVAGQTLAGWLMIGADGGAYREQLLTQFKDGCEAARALQRGEVAAAAGLASELETVLAGDAAYRIEPLPSPRAPRDGWAAGMAVKRDATDLAEALQDALNQLTQQGRVGEIFAKYKVVWRPA
ncbi:ABC transporter substrate-binding protein [Pelomonas sp. Root1217]|uniref:substrate-binding periplasmic protein n=1 Tax=Pelomonas sp. Root1217 TaxID=1736430 RepID=UPI00070E83FC|nr:transporter substrate-binding domain-containing protein [Pelomonas sp. Root1217]KQV50842.1 ABC transporter substrate-binding protein [Pelomonas sp. Root1217]